MLAGSNRRRSAPRATCFRAVGGAVLLLAAALGFGCSREATRPNVLLLSVDSVRRDHVGAYGWRSLLAPTEPVTPAFDRLAAEGVVFEDALSTTSWTLPAHMALLTGLPDALHGVTDNRKRLDPALPTLAGFLGSKGYATGGFYSGPNLHPAFGFDQGFDSYVSCTGARPSEELFEDPEEGDFVQVHTASHRDVTSPLLLKRASAWLEQAAAGERPFFLFVHWWDPHYDYLAPEDYARRFDPDYEGAIRGEHAVEKTLPMSERDVQHLLALYDAEIRFTEDHIEKLLEKLDELGLADDTIVLLTSDHGEEFYEHGRWGHQRTLYEEVVRIPMVLRWPGHVPAGIRAAGQARLQDVLPTIAELLDLPPPANVAGRSLARLWEDPAAPGPPQDLHLSVPLREIELVGRRAGPWKALWDRHEDRVRVWSLARDPEERNPLAFDAAAADEVRAPMASAFWEELRTRVEELDALRARLPATAGHGEATLPPELVLELEASGYLGGDE